MKKIINIKENDLINLIENLISEVEDKKDKTKLNKYYDDIISLIRKHSRDLNDDDAYELHEKLKKFFNKLI